MIHPPRLYRMVRFALALNMRENWPPNAEVAQISIIAGVELSEDVLPRAQLLATLKVLTWNSQGIPIGRPS